MLHSLFGVVKSDYTNKVRSVYAGTQKSALRADVVHDIERSHLKVVAVGSPTDAVDLLSLIRIWMDQ
jgi:hypothetical protein